MDCLRVTPEDAISPGRELMYILPTLVPQNLPLCRVSECLEQAQRGRRKSRLDHIRELVQGTFGERW